MSRKEDDIMFTNYKQIRVVCKYCGHTNTIPVFLDNKNCTYCGRNIKNQGLAYFKYKMRKEMKK